MSRFGSLCLCSVAALGLANCATPKPTKTASTDAAAASHLTAEQIQEAEKAGYHVVVSKSGGTLFCQKRMVKTGSHVAKDECHTAEEWNQLHVRGNQQAHDEIDKASMKQLPAVAN